MLRWTSFVLFAIVAGCQSDAPTEQEEDKKTGASADLVGIWQLVETPKDGDSLPEDRERNIWWEFTGSKIKMIDEDDEAFAEYKVDDSKSPATIDVTFTRGFVRGETYLGIFDIQGDRLRLCFGFSGAPRPTDFKAQESDRRGLNTFVRFTPKRAEALLNQREKKSSDGK